MNKVVALGAFSKSSILDYLSQILLGVTRYLGALTIFCFWIALVSGVYLFIFYETSLSGAWLSVERMTHEQWYVGGLMRSLHRYSSDLALLGMFAHLIREFYRGRFKGVFWFSWITGIPLIWLVYTFGISGYWMVWDEVAQVVALGTARLLDALPIFTDPMIRAFLSNEAVSERFFTLIAFIHLVGLPIVLVLAIWFHLLRIRLPRINPPKPIMLACLLLLVLVSVIRPVVSHAPADMSVVPNNLQLDWLYLAVYPLMDFSSEALIWLLVTGFSLLLLLLPLWPVPKPVVAETNLDNCSACGFCAEDCPYGAITMVPRTDGRKLELQAEVDPDLCVGCGVCVGACPSSSPFRHKSPLFSGIEMPNLGIDGLKQRLDAMRPASASASAPETGTAGARLLVVGCDQGLPVREQQTPGVHGISLPCIGMLPTAFIDYSLKNTADAVLIAGCVDCHYRYGDEWLVQRLQSERDPVLRSRVPKDRVHVRWLGAHDQAGLGQAIADVRAALATRPMQWQTPDGAVSPQDESQHEPQDKPLEGRQ